VNNDSEIDRMISILGRLPGLGPRSSRRIALHLLNNKDNLMIPLAHSILETAANIKDCLLCGNIDIISPCSICVDEKREDDIICVVEGVSDLWALERSGFYKGKYNVLGGVLDALSGIGPDKLNIKNLILKIKKEKIKEVILATSATLSGQTTAHYINEKIKGFDVKITRLSRGLPVGGELDYLDDGTLGQALKERITVLD